jgi:hypothetical protein
MGVMNCLMKANRGELSHRSLEAAISRDNAESLTALCRGPLLRTPLKVHGSTGLHRATTAHDTASTKCGSSSSSVPACGRSRWLPRLQIEGTKLR